MFQMIFRNDKGTGLVVCMVTKIISFAFAAHLRNTDQEARTPGDFISIDILRYMLK